MKITRRLIPGQMLPRAIDVTMTKQAGGTLRLGCLVCGDEIFKAGTIPTTTTSVGLEAHPSVLRVGLSDQ